MASSYRDLEVWQKGIDLATQIYLKTKEFPQEEKFGLTHQLRKAAVSIPSNIAEGQARRTKKDFSHFCYISKGSAAEIDTQLIIAQRIEMINQNDAESLIDETIRISKMIQGLIKSLEP